MKTTQLSRAEEPVRERPARAAMRAITRAGTAPCRGRDAAGRDDRPDIGANEVLIQVRAAGVDRGTWHVMAGQPYLMRLLGFGFRGPRNPCRALTWRARLPRSARP